MMKFLRCLLCLSLLLSLSNGPVLAELSADRLAGLSAPLNTNETQVPVPPPSEQQPLVITGRVFQTDYIINSGDTVHIEDINEGILVKEGEILSDGTVSIPLLGMTRLAGLSVKEAKQRLIEKYKKFYVNPNIVVQVLKQRPIRVYIQGAVAHPGIYVSGKTTSRDHSLAGTVTPLGNYNTMYSFYRLCLTDALLMAGGLSNNASVRDIKIKRSFPEPTTIHVNLMDMFQNGNTIQDLPLRDQDVVEVAALPANAIMHDEQWEEFARSNIVQNTIRVTVLGAVGSPGAYTLSGSKDNVLSAIAKAGGFDENASHEKIYLLRTTSTGQVVKRELNLKDKAMMGKKPFETWSALLPNDIIFVDQSSTRTATEIGTNLLNQASSAMLFPIFNNMFNKPEASD